MVALVYGIHLSWGCLLLQLADKAVGWLRCRWMESHMQIGAPALTIAVFCVAVSSGLEEAGQLAGLPSVFVKTSGGTHR